MENVLKRARDGYYRNKTGIPARPSEPNKPVFDTPEKIGRYNKLLKDYQIELANYQNALSVFNDKCNNMEKVFRDDLENDFQTKGHPKADDLYRLAMERGNFSGKEAVVYAYIDLLVLVR